MFDLGAEEREASLGTKPNSEIGTKFMVSASPSVRPPSSVPLSFPPFLPHASLPVLASLARPPRPPPFLPLLPSQFSQFRRLKVIFLAFPSKESCLPLPSDRAMLTPLPDI